MLAVVSTKQMPNALVNASTGVTSDLHTLGHVVFADPNHGPQTPLVGRDGRFNYRVRHCHVHSE